MKTFVLLILLLLAACKGFAQPAPAGNDTSQWGLVALPPDDPSLVEGTYLLAHGGYHSLVYVPTFLFVQYTTMNGLRMRHRNGGTPLPGRRKPFLTVHGSVMYDFYYQSNADTPYLEKEIYQHTLQTSLEVTIRDQYPLRVNFTTRMGNSYLFRDLTGLNMQFTNRDLKHALLQKAQSWDAGRSLQWKELEQLKQLITAKANEINRLRSWASASSQLQKMVEAQEQELYKRQRDSLLNTARQRIGQDSLQQPAIAAKADSAVQRLNNLYTANAGRIDSLQQELSKLERLYRQKQQLLSVRKEQVIAALTRSRNNKELAENLEALHLPDTILPKGYKALLAIRSVGIGRTMVDYSELTAKSISITGFQAEYNPSWYLAFATGAVDYRFRDYIVNSNRTRQYLNIVRAGIGMREGNNIILSFYTGKKQVYNFSSSGNPNVETPDYRIMGWSLEGRWQLHKHHYIVGEAAKSSLPYYSRKGHDQGLSGSMLSFSDHSNEAYAVSTYSFIPISGTRINAMYKLMGANFQSFSLYPSGSRQSAWMVRVDQPFFQQQLTVSGSMRKNIYTSIFENANYQSNTIFSSIQATFRRKRWPVVTLGYFPSSQLMKLGDDKYIENLFYTLVGTASHFYQYKGISMNTMFSGTRFYNRQTDSNFVYFNSTNLLLNQTVFLGRFTLNGGLSSATNQDYALYGADAGVQYKVTQWLEAGGGLKYNYQTVYRQRQTGYSANVRVNIPKVGEVALMADKGFIPGVNRQLVPNETGRLTYTRIF